KPRYFFTLALAATLAYVLGAGCTQDFGSFKPCTVDQKVCGQECVGLTDPAYGCSATECSPCSLDHASAACTADACDVAGCEAGFQSCDGDGTNGCEVATTTDPAHCGMCGNACVIPHATAACNAGACAVGTCDAGFQD